MSLYWTHAKKEPSKKKKDKTINEATSSYRSLDHPDHLPRRCFNLKATFKELNLTDKFPVPHLRICHCLCNLLLSCYTADKRTETSTVSWVWKQTSWCPKTQKELHNLICRKLDKIQLIGQNDQQNQTKSELNAVVSHVSIQQFRWCLYWHTLVNVLKTSFKLIYSGIFFSI